MKITLTSIQPRRARSKTELTGQLLTDYESRISRYVSCETSIFESEVAFFEWLDSQATRTTPYLILLDSRGKQLSSEEFAEKIARLRDSGSQRIVFAIGPADGWSDASRARANLLVSFGRITLPHQLARVVLAEQVYRAFTILAGHPYHSGH